MEKKNGGRRKGAGRPKNSGPWGEPTMPVRVPYSLYDEFRQWVMDKMKERYEGKVVMWPLSIYDKTQD